MHKTIQFKMKCQSKADCVSKRSDRESVFMRQLSRDMTNKIVDIGRAIELLKVILDDNIFYDTSKFDDFWHSEHELEGEKLNSTRMRLESLHDKIWDVWDVLKGIDEGDASTEFYTGDMFDSIPQQ